MRRGNSASPSLIQPGQDGGKHLSPPQNHFPPYTLLDLIPASFIPAHVSRSMRWLRDSKKQVGNRNDIASVIALSDCALTRGPISLQLGF